MIVMLGDWHVSKQIIPSQKYSAMPTMSQIFPQFSCQLFVMTCTSEEELKIEAFLL